MRSGSFFDTMAFGKSLKTVLRVVLQQHKWALRTRDIACRHLSKGMPEVPVMFRSKLEDGPSFQDFLRNSSPTTNYLPQTDEDPPPYLENNPPAGDSQKVYLETYGCQMNVSDAEIAWAILKESGYRRTYTLAEADVVLLVTCSIREKAEQTVWNRLHDVAALKRKRCSSQLPLRIGILGCMAERLKEEILEREKLVDVVAGPDAYRDLPRLLSVAESGQQAANVLLSMDETYADIMPVHLTSNTTSAFVSIMRGCDNMCTYCIVPFTRGRERSRPISSILQEVRMLSDKVLQLIQERHNICKQIHLPVQSGSSRVLQAMGRGYTRETYLELVQHVREYIPGVSLSSDFIAGFCGETEDDHQQTVSLLRTVRYNIGFLFAYSMRAKTRAYHRLEDDVLPEVKHRRLDQLVTVFREEASEVNRKAVGITQLVLVEGPSKRSLSDLAGRNDGNVKVIFPDIEVEDEHSGVACRARPGDYLLVKITRSSSQSLRGVPLHRSSLRKSYGYR
ncbi:mitochondrial tRNA methylthiotransferase CDK5RAP1 isoform X3 [Ambystoma mexicanum]|uniref:mitochondrial tRNA methylthiotransferase CDK5RAP1 isoform X3 n=1 Tax=Ambystoma mexicanum TaxID=8296 RepID=UPI0037E968B7